MCKCGFVLQFDWYHQSQVPEVDNFSHRFYQALSSPNFEERAWEQGYLQCAFRTINGTAQVCIGIPIGNILEASEVGTLFTQDTLDGINGVHSIEVPL